MKKIILPLLAAMCTAFAVSCTTGKESADDFASAISIDKTEVELAYENVVAQKVAVTADGEWLVTAPEWVSVEPGYGNGNATITVTAPENINEYREPLGPRYGKVTVIGSSDKVSASFTVTQTGENGLDISKNYTLITKAEDLTAGQAYVIAALDKDEKYQAATPVPAKSAYGYLGLTEVEVSEEGEIARPNGDNGFVFETAATEGQYYIKQSDGRYLYCSGTFASFNVADKVDDADADKGFSFTVAFGEGGEVTITNVKKNKIVYCQTKVNGGSYDEYLVYDAEAAAPKGHLLPKLYKDSKVPTGEVLQVNSKVVGYNAVTASLKIVSNRTWKVRNHDSWVKTFTKSGEGDGVLEVTFDANNSTEKENVATFTVIGESMYLEVSLTQRQILSAVMPYEEAFTSNIGKFVVEDKTGFDVWTEGGNNGMVAKGNKVETESWLVSPSISLAGAEHAYLSYDQAANYFDSQDNFKAAADVFVKEAGAAEWTKVVPLEYPTGNSWTWVNSGSIDLAAWLGKTIIVGFKYTSTTSVSGTWEIKNFKVKPTAVPDLAFASKSVIVKPGATVANAASSTMSAGAITYKSSNEAVATVDASGVITGVAEGSATITATLAASGVYEAQTATCSVTVSSMAVLKIVPADLPTGYQNEGYTIKVSELDFYCVNVASFSGGPIQMKKSGSYVANKSSLGQIKKIVLKWNKNFYPENLALTDGAAELPSGDALTYTKNDTEMTATFDLSAKSPAYFKLANPSSYASYLDYIEITYKSE